MAQAENPYPPGPLHAGFGAGQVPVLGRVGTGPVIHTWRNLPSLDCNWPEESIPDDGWPSTGDSEARSASEGRDKAPRVRLG